jgi:hypothetical protein
MEVSTSLKCRPLYRQSFINDPIKALRDLAGIPPAIGDPFIGSVDKIESCRTRWIDRHGTESPVNDSVTDRCLRAGSVLTAILASVLSISTSPPVLMVTLLAWRWATSRHRRS